MLRDPIACKPAVMAESDDWVAMASEYRAIATLPGADDAGVGAGGHLLGPRKGGLGVAPATAESVDLASVSVRDLNQRLHDAEAGTKWVVANPNGALDRRRA